MTTVILIIHIIISISIVGLVLMQRSEGGGLGIGGGNNFMSARGTADLLTRATTILAVAFFCTSILLAMLAGYGKKSTSIIDEVKQESITETENKNNSTPSVPTNN
ncbi:MAG: preprotein translocase subunit SecG [SAR116 cluster bacterium]|nr:preprotein translocase subunit SecG [SAR116 cluster bacterium]